MSDHRSKLLQDWTLGDWQDEAKAQREARETAEHQLHEARTQVERAAKRSQREWETTAEWIRRAESAETQLERCQEALREIEDYMRLHHGENHGALYQGCGTDACVACLVHGIAERALSQQSVPNTPRCHGCGATDDLRLNEAAGRWWCPKCLELMAARQP